jgi:hypothetical protein
MEKGRKRPLREAATGSARPANAATRPGVKIFKLCEYEDYGKDAFNLRIHPPPPSNK